MILLACYSFLLNFFTFLAVIMLIYYTNMIVLYGSYYEM